MRTTSSDPRDPSVTIQLQQHYLTSWQKTGICILGLAVSIAVIAVIVFTNIQFVNWACHNGYTNKFLLGTGIFIISLGEVLIFSAIMGILAKVLTKISTFSSHLSLKRMFSKV